MRRRARFVEIVGGFVRGRQAGQGRLGVMVLMCGALLFAVGILPYLPSEQEQVPQREATIVDDAAVGVRNGLQRLMYGEPAQAETHQAETVGEMPADGPDEAPAVERVESRPKSLPFKARDAETDEYQGRDGLRRTAGGRLVTGWRRFPAGGRPVEILFEAGRAIETRYVR